MYGMADEAHLGVFSKPSAATIFLKIHWGMVRKSPAADPK